MSPLKVQGQSLWVTRFVFLDEVFMDTSPRHHSRGLCINGAGLSTNPLTVEVVVHLNSVRIDGITTDS